MPQTRTLVIRALAALAIARALGAQTPVVAVSPTPKLQFFDATGARPLAGGCVATFQAGTDIPMATYTDSSGSVPNQNPVTLDSSGRAAIWINASAIKYVVTTKVGALCAMGAGSVLYTVDNVQDQGLRLRSDLAGGNGGDYVGVTPPGGVNTPISTTLKNCPFDVQYASLALAIANIPPYGCLNVVGSWNMSASINMPGLVSLYCQPGSAITQTGTDYHFAIHSSHTTIDGCTLDGNSTGGGIDIGRGGVGAGLDSTTATNLTCRNVTNVCVTLSGDGFNGDPYLTHTRIINIHAMNSGGAVFSNYGIGDLYVDGLTCIYGTIASSDCIHVINYTPTPDTAPLSYKQVIQNVFCQNENRICFEYQSVVGQDVAQISNITSAYPAPSAAGCIAISFAADTANTTEIRRGILAKNIQVYDPNGVCGEDIEFIFGHGVLDGFNIYSGSTTSTGVGTGGPGVMVSHGYIHGGLNGIATGFGVFPNNNLRVSDVYLEEQCSVGIYVLGRSPYPADTISGSAVSRVNMVKTPGSCSTDAGATWYGFFNGDDVGTVENLPAVTFRDINILMKSATAVPSGFIGYGLGTFGAMPIGTLYDSISIVDQNTTPVLAGYVFNSPQLLDKQSITNNTFINLAPQGFYNAGVIHYAGNRTIGGAVGSSSFIASPFLFANRNFSQWDSTDSEFCSDCLVNIASVINGPPNISAGPGAYVNSNNVGRYVPTPMTAKTCTLGPNTSNCALGGTEASGNANFTVTAPIAAFSIMVTAGPLADFSSAAKYCSFNWNAGGYLPPATGVYYNNDGGNYFSIATYGDIPAGNYSVIWVCGR